MKPIARRILAAFLPFALLGLVLCGRPALGEEARPLADDPLTEKRLQAISGELRCLVCQNETLAASQADLAKDLREEIRGMIRAGRSDQEIMDFMVNRYGDFVRYRPPLKPTTLLLWGGPLVLFIVGLLALRANLRRRAQRLAEQPPLDETEARRAEALLAGPSTDPERPAPDSDQPASPGQSS
jgi:cytochrome c-type biogenesis protein CcmH